jgi:ribose/xylose/arabinose/galactoside ABC-type transport system permease subunit
LLRQQGIYVVLVTVVVIASVGVPQFATGGNIKALLESVSIEGLVALGMTFVIISGSLIDLSVPSVVALSAIITLSLEPNGVALAIAVSIAVSACVGVANGLIVSMGGNPVIVTLAVGTILLGIDTGLNGGNAVYGHPSVLQTVANKNIGPVPELIIVFLLAVLLVQVTLRQTTFGFHVYALGANRAAARISGVPTWRVLVGVFTASAVLAALAGVLAGAFGNEADARVGVGYDFYALTAVVVGGTSLFGGQGDAGRTLAGILLVGVIDNAMILLNLSTNLQPVVLGILIVVMVGADAAFRRGRV